MYAYIQKLQKNLRVKTLFSRVFLCLALFFSFHSGEGKSLENPDIFLFSEIFGDKKNPAILLNAGAGSQSIVWADAFCKNLAQKGYFVIRYDYRDTGLSSQIDYEQHPYDIKDLAEDALHVLEKHKIQKAHFVGFSMGGEVAQFVGAYQPSSALSLILIGTSSDFNVGLQAFEGKTHSQGLSAPDALYLKWAMRPYNLEEQSLEEKVQDYVETWRILDGRPEEFNEEYYRAEGMRNYTRTKFHTPYRSHAKAMKASLEEQEKAPFLIKTKTLIIQGTKDPVFGVDHGENMHRKIKNSKLIIFKDLGHAISPQNFDRIIDAIDRFIKNL